MFTLPAPPRDDGGQLILRRRGQREEHEAASDVLQATGYRTLEASTGAQAVRLATEHCPALVLMDIRLPDMDGLEALQPAATGPRTASIPVLAVTAQAMKGDRERFRRRASTATSRTRSTSTSCWTTSVVTRDHGGASSPGYASCPPPRHGRRRVWRRRDRVLLDALLTACAAPGPARLQR